MLTVLFRATVLFFFAVLVHARVGKRQIGQLQPYELVIAIMIADLAATPMGDIGVPLLYGIMPMLMLMLLHSVLSLLSLKSQAVRALLNGKPSVLVRRGIIQRKELCRSCYDLNDLLEEIRASGVMNPAEVGTMILETSGKVSVFPKAAYRAVTPEDLKLQTGYEGIPLTLVLDGRLERQNLAAGGLEEKWLLQKLKALGFAAFEEVLLASLDTDGMLFVQGKGEKPKLVIARALAPKEVVW